MMRIGILAVQGAFVEHQHALEQCGASSFLIRQSRDLQTDMDALILPGGESTTMEKLLPDLHLFAPILAQIQAGLPVWGTCAGLILLAQNVIDGQVCFGTMHITAKRNAYGRQLGSFQTTATWRGLGPIPMVFIRAPYIESTEDTVTPLAYVDKKLVAAREGNQLVTAFHPELTTDLQVHQYFLQMVQSK